MTTLANRLLECPPDNRHHVLSRAALDRSDVAFKIVHSTEWAWGIDLRGSSFRQAFLCSVCMNSLDLTGVDFTEAAMRHSQLIGAQLRDAQLRDADLEGSSVHLASVEGALIGTMRIRRIVARVFRTHQSYEFFLWETEESADGRWLVRAGCRTRTLVEYMDIVEREIPTRLHSDARMVALLETRDILAYFSARARHASGA